ncbi:MAG: tyrosine-type recombinase/integrase [Anaerolineales bacterium]|jgi:site-specific recombinase XerD
MPFGDAVELHLKAMKRRGRSEVTIGARRYWLGCLGEFLAGREPTLELLREWADDLPARGLKVRSCWTAIVNARAFFNWMAEEEITPTHIARRLEKPRLPKHLPKAFTPEQVTKLLDTAATGQNPERDEALILFLLETGCRRGGAANLGMDDLNLEAAPCSRRRATSRGSPTSPPEPQRPSNAGSGPGTCMSSTGTIRAAIAFSASALGGWA